MKTPVLAVLLTTLGLLPAGLAQEPAAPQEPGTKQTEKTTEQWIAELGADSFRARVAAEKALRDLGTSALPALKRAAEEAKDPEVQWRARRLVRSLERGDDRGLAKRQDGGGRAVAPGHPMPDRTEWMQRRFEEMFEQIERDMGIDIPKARFFADDFFRDLKAQVPGGAARSQGMAMQIGPDGSVRVEVKTTNDKGEVETKTYEAKSMADFEAQYPGVLQQNGLGFGLRWQHDMDLPLLRSFAFPRLDRQPWSVAPGMPGVPEAEEAAGTPPPASRLGVSIRPTIGDELREHLGLDQGVGLWVEAVQPGTLAAELGLQRGDVVTSIAGTSIGSPADVQKVLGGIDAGTEVEVGFLRKGAALVAKAKKPAAPAEDGGRRERRELRKAGSGDSTIR